MGGGLPVKLWRLLLKRLPVHASKNDLNSAPKVTTPTVDGLKGRGQGSRQEGPSGSFDMAGCVRRVRHRDEEAARALMEQLYPLVLKVVRSHLPRRTSEEDLVQIVFMKVFAKIDQYQGQVPVEHWVSRIAVNSCLNELKAERVRPELRWADLSEEAQHVVESLAAEEPAPRDTAGLAARELLQQLLARLSPPDRLVITLLHLEEKSVVEVRAITGWSAALVKVRAFRARKKLQKHLNQLENDHEKARLKR